jgi:hypothetical protein
MTVGILNSTFIVARRTRKTEPKRSQMAMPRLVKKNGGQRTEVGVECRVRTSNQTTRYRQIEDLV